jgi:hypothetical protein
VTSVPRVGAKLHIAGIDTNVVRVMFSEGTSMALWETSSPAENYVKASSRPAWAAQDAPTDRTCFAIQKLETDFIFHYQGLAWRQRSPDGRRGLETAVKIGELSGHAKSR